MRKYYFITVLIFLLKTQLSFSQSTPSYKWWDPADATFPVIDGRGWQNDLVRTYDRLPAKAEKTVRPEVWALSQNSAGEYIRFLTNATEIVVRYVTTGSKSMNHMPATGVSGVDLYARDNDNNWRWARGSYSFGDTVVYRFTNIVSPVPINEFRLYLPLYNSVTWMKIGVPTQNSFTVLPVSEEQPIVLYGTSIMQGACASRPGLAWTNILGRKLNMPIINLGFSGNGRLEQPLIDLMNETRARLFVLDCQPNLHDRNVYSQEEIEKRIINSVKSLQSRHPQTPVLLAEHCCGSPAVNMDTSFVNKYHWTSTVLTNAFLTLKRDGVQNIYVLTATEIGFDAASTVDGTHPTDIGMVKYADAYEKKIREIFNKK